MNLQTAINSKLAIKGELAIKCELAIKAINNADKHIMFKILHLVIQTIIY